MANRAIDEITGLGRGIRDWFSKKTNTSSPSRLHVFVDGSWLFKACGRERALSGRLEFSDQSFRLDFRKFDQVLLRHARRHQPACEAIGDQFLSTSIFGLPADIDDWPSKRTNVTTDDVNRVRENVAAREKFVTKAFAVGYSREPIHRPPLKDWMLGRLREHRYQEKQVDATVVALLVRSAIVNPGDVHAIITGDADVLPAIKVAYPEYSQNVFVAMTHPDQLRPEARQASFRLADFKSKIPPLYLDENVPDLLEGNNIYSCGHCSKVFARNSPIPVAQKPRCKPCNDKRK